MSALSLLLLAAILIAGTSRSLSWDVRLYFGVQFLSTFVAEVILRTFGWQSEAYSYAYGFESWSILAAMLVIVIRSKASWMEYGAASIMSLAMAALALSSAALTFSLNDWLIFLEGLLALFLGIALAFRAYRSATLITLAILWQVLAAFDLAFLLNPNSHFWLGINYWITYWITSAAFLWIGWQERMPRAQQLHTARRSS